MFIIIIICFLWELAKNQCLVYWCPLKWNRNQRQEFLGTLGFLFQLADRKGWIQQSSPWSSYCSRLLNNGFTVLQKGPGPSPAGEACLPPRRVLPVDRKGQGSNTGDTQVQCSKQAATQVQGSKRTWTQRNDTKSHGQKGWLKSSGLNNDVDRRGQGSNNDNEIETWRQTNIAVQTLNSTNTFSRGAGKHQSVCGLGRGVIIVIPPP